MTEKAFAGGTDPLVEDLGDGTHIPIIKVFALNTSSQQNTGNGLTEAQLAAAGLALESTAQAIRNRLPSAFLTPGLLAVDTLGTPGTPRIQATSALVASIALTTTCRRISMYATQGTWFNTAGPATATSHFIAAGERLDFDVPASTTISVLRETVDGSIRITELV